MNNWDYMKWAFARNFGGSTTCPSCKSPSRQIRRKYLVTSLRECSNCALRFRFPKDEPETATKHYVEETYKQGFTTDLPSDASLEEMLSTSFKGMEKDFSRHLAILSTLGLEQCDRVVDFGSSWGYGSWQMKQAGYEVLSLEIGSVRRRYAEEKLGCTIVDDLQAVAGTVDCFFSAHVIEHLTDPRIFFDAAALVLKPTGIIVCFCPNGAVQREALHRKEYDKNWGLVHPLMITPEFMKREAERRGFSACSVFSDATAEMMAAHTDGPLGGSELLTVCWRGQA